VPRLPVLSGSRVGVLNAPDDVVVLRPPAPGEAIADVGAAIRDALRFPLSGEPLEALVTRGGRATIVVEPPVLPFPGGHTDPRQAALTATIDELERLGVPTAKQTVLVAGGLGRRAGQRDLEALLGPPLARRFRGRVVAHDTEDEGLVEIGRFRVHPALAQADLILPLTAAETVLDGGPGALLRSCDARTLRAAGADSLLETARSDGWRLGLELEQALGRRSAVLGASLVLNQPRLTGAFRGYPHEPGSIDQVASSRLRRVLSALPAAARRSVIEGLPRELTAAAAFAGPPSVAHAEALVRAIASRAVPLGEPLDAIVIGLPWRTPQDGRERLNPITATWLALGFALRLWRDGFPVADGGTAIIAHRFTRTFGQSGAPYRELFETLRESHEAEHVAASERSAAENARALAEYRAGRACHPLLPYALWSACAPALARLGAVIVAGCRDAHAARTLDFVPTHGTSTALAMAYGRAGGEARVGVLLAPPWFPLQLGGPA
jgi:hypothetical protein